MSRRRQAARLGGTELPLGSSVLDVVAAREREAYLRRREELAPRPPIAQRSTMSEGAWQRQVVELATTLGYYVYHPKLSRWSARGWPDLSLLGSRALWLECKTDAGHLTEGQVEVIDRMLACGLEVHTVRPSHGLDYVASLLQSQGPAVKVTP